MPGPAIQAFSSYRSNREWRGLSADAQVDKLGIRGSTVPMYNIRFNFNHITGFQMLGSLPFFLVTSFTMETI